MNRNDNNNDHRAAVAYIVSIRKEIRSLVDPYRIPDSIFLTNFRLSKDLTRALVRQLTRYLPDDSDAHSVPNSIKVLSVLNFYATGGYQAAVGCNWLHCIGRSTMGRFIQQVTGALNEPRIQRRWIKFPRTVDERRVLRERHEREFLIPGVIGFIDGTEVTIVTPPENTNPQTYWTRKNQYALNCQIICDSNLTILSINASYAGAAGDAFVYRYTAARRRIKEGFENDNSSWFLGDSAYPSEPWCLIPILDAPEESPERYFTECHCRARNCVERCIGCLKARFRCLLRARALHYHPLVAGMIFKACCVLHNICRKAGIPDEDLDIVEGEEEPVPWVPQEHEALLVQELEPDDPDPALDVNAANERRVREVGHLVRQRIVEYLDFRRQGLLH